MAYQGFAPILTTMGTNPLHRPDYEVFTLLLRSTREKAGLTQVELANRIGMDQSAISKIERRERRLDVTELRRICIALGVPFATFISRLERELSERERDGAA